MYSSKDALRQSILKIRNAVPTEMLDKMSDDIKTKLLSMDKFADAIAIGAYYSIGSEVRTNEIIKKALQMNKRLALPRVIDDSIVFAKIRSMNDLTLGKYRIMEPKEDCEIMEEIDLVLVPGIVWDERGYRIGYGKGFYDRYLAKLDTLSIGLAYDFQVFEEIPNSRNDFHVDMIVTERRIVVTKG